MKKPIISRLFFLLCMISTAVYADYYGRTTSLGTVANNLMQPVNLFESFLNTACFLLGGSFVFASIIKYLEHRRSPLMVSISTVVFLFIAGFLLVLFPFLHMLLTSKS